MNEDEIRAALGIDDDADPVAAIGNLRTEVASLKASIALDKPTAEKVELAQVRNELAEARGKLIIEQTENSRKIAAIEAAARKDRVEARVEKAISSGKPPVMRDQLLEYGMSVSMEQLDNFIATIPSVDLTEHGVASGTELSALEPTPIEITIAKQMGNWNEEKPNESRLALMKVKAKEQGLRLPAELA